MKRKKKVFSVNDKLRVRKSYYTFTKEYPQGFVRIQRSKRRINKKQIRRGLLYALCFVILLCISYFAVSLGLEISYKPIDNIAQNEIHSSAYAVLSEQGVKALYVPYTRLGDENYLRNAAKQVQKKNGNSVVIDFKTKEGKLVYSSLQENAVAGKCALYDNDTVRRALDIFDNAGLAVIARIYCFEDSCVAMANSSLAVKYMNTDVNWLDGSDEKGGKPWLNPYSKEVRNYLTGIVREISSFGVGAFMLESMQFPDGENTSGATYPGEKDKAKRNAALKNITNQIKNALPENALLIFSQSASDCVSINEAIYFGSMTELPVYAVAADTRERPLSVAVDKKTDYVSILSMYSAAAAQYPGKKIIPLVDVSEYSYSYFRSMKKSGFDSFILYSETGEY
ncbi:MAG: hypothetical protein IKB94_03100 [Clostridia bacterium]|nr:hypothetical protein [Clostridia bacterium]